MIRSIMSRLPITVTMPVLLALPVVIVAVVLSLVVILAMLMVRLFLPLVSKLRKIRSGNLEHEVHLDQTLELTQLSGEIDTMTAGLRDRMRMRQSLAAVACVMLVAVAAQQGCLITAATVATIHHMKSRGGYTEKVEIEKSPEEVYDAMVRVVDRRSDLKVHKKDEKHFLVEVSKDKNRVSAQAKELRPGVSELTVRVVETEKGTAREDMALDVVKKICDELGVKYRVREETRK